MGGASPRRAIDERSTADVGARARRGRGHLTLARRDPETLPGVSAVTHPEPLAPGTILAATYRLDRLLAHGGVGVVYLGWDLLLEREVAVKILLPAHAANPRTAAMFHREAIAMAGVCHINLVQIFSSGQHDDLPFLVMEYVRGQTIAALLRAFYGRGRVLGLHTVSSILRQAARGLQAMREHGIFHGDVKPSNMLIDAEHRVAISDFGLVGSARAGSEHSTERGYFSGTPLYVAPELISGAEVTPEKRHLCDVYSLGVSVFEMLTGEGPFAAATIHEILRGHLFTPPPRVTSYRPDLPVAIDGVIARALAKDPRRRYQDCVRFAADVDRVVRQSERGAAERPPGVVRQIFG
jgi:eukaryotic-like serine/threonine-protein kinase